MEYFLPDGIPKRTAACRCLLGNLRSDPLTEESSETTIDYEYITGCAERAGAHDVTTSLPEGYINNLTAFKNYPTKLPLSSDDPNTHLVIKARGVPQMDDDGNPTFPSIKLTLRPLSTYLDYTWLGDAGARRQATPVNSLGENEFGEIIVDDFPPSYDFEAPNQAQLKLTYSGVGEDGCPAYYFEEGVVEAYEEAFTNNYNEAVSRFGELGAMQTYKGEFFYRVDDLPPSLDPATYAPPLKPQEIDLTLYPHIDGEEPYQFKMNESWDLRYRYPSWWNERGGLPYFDEADTEQWIWEPTTVLETQNPFLFGGQNTLVPVQKYLRIFDPEGFPVNPTPDPSGIWDYSFYGHNARPLFQGGQIESVSVVRKRYPYSFNAPTRVFEGSEFFYVWDFNSNNYTEGVAPPVGETSCGTLVRTPLVYGITYQGRNNYGGLIEPTNPTFECESRWRMELQVDRDEWNFDKSLDKGWKIKGKVKFSKLLLSTANPDQTKQGENINIWSQNLTTCISRVPTFPLADGILGEPFSAGELDFEVEVKKDNATGSPIAVMDIPIGGLTTINGQVVRCGDVPEFSINYISDFYITEIVPPQ